jgi:hypothetical protein
MFLRRIDELLPTRSIYMYAPGPVSGNREGHISIPCLVAVSTQKARIKRTHNLHPG